jgi:dTDP-4-dehydrorhamnose reductase
VYNAGAKDCITKYEFGLKLKSTFSLTNGEIIPGSVKDMKFLALRSTNMSMNCTKLGIALSRDILGVDEGIERFYKLCVCGYPQRLKGELNR